MGRGHKDDRGADEVAGRQLPRWWPAVAAVAAGLAFVAHDRLLGFTEHYGLFGNGVDAVVYRYGGLTVRTSESLYSFVLFDLLPFTYPPFAAILFVPLSLLSIPGTTIAVNLTNLVLLYLAIWLSWRVLGYADTGRVRMVSLALAAVCTWLEPVRMTIWLGQINLLLLVLVLWDLTRPDSARLRGIGVGIAAGLKLTPALFIAYLAVVRQWRAVTVATATFAATIAVGFVVIFSDACTFFTDAILRSDRIGLMSSPANQSIRGILARALHTDQPPMWLWLGAAAATAGLGMWAAAAAYRHGQQLLSLTVCGLTAPMVSPFSWGHHWVWTVPLVVLCLDRAARWGRWWGYVLPAATLVPLLAWYRSYPDQVVAIGIFMTPGGPMMRMLAQCAYPLVFLTLVAVTLAWYGRRRPPLRPVAADTVVAPRRRRPGPATPTPGQEAPAPETVDGPHRSGAHPDERDETAPSVP